MQKRDCDRQTNVALMKEKKQPYPCTRAAGSVLTGPGQGPGRQVRSEPCQSIQVDPSIRSVRQTKKWPQDPARWSPAWKIINHHMGGKIFFFSALSISLISHISQTRGKKRNKRKKRLCWCLSLIPTHYTLHSNL